MRYYNPYKKQKVSESKEEVAVLCYPPVMPLQEISAAKIVTSMLMHNDAQQEIINFFTENMKNERWGRDCALPEYNDWREVVRKVQDRLSSLPTSQSIIAKLSIITHSTAESIYNWIEYNDSKILETYSNSEYSAANYIDNIQWNTRGKIDYLQTAKNILAKENSKLSNTDKYTIACNYCLEDYVIALAPKVYLGRSYMTMNRFWNSYVMKRNNAVDISGLYEGLHEYNDDRGTHVSVNEYIFTVLVRCDDANRYIRVNDIPIRYMWNKLTDAEKSRNIKLAIKEIKNADLVYFLFSQRDYEQQQDIFKDHDCAKNILNNLFQELWLEEGFLRTVLHMLNVMQGVTYLYILGKIMNYNCKYDSRGYGLDSKYKHILIKLWQAAPQHLKDFVFANDKGKLFHKLVADSSLSWENDVDVVKLILTDMNVQQKNALLFSNECRKQIQHLVMYDQWHLFENLIKYAGYTKDTIDCFKQELMEIYDCGNGYYINGFYIAKLLIQNKKWNQVDYFLNWAFISPEEINKFKQKLMERCGYDIAEEWIKHKEWEQVEYLLNWAFASIEEINEFKHNLGYRGVYDLCNCILVESAVADDFSGTSYFLQWSLIIEDEIHLFKTSKLMKSILFSELVLRLVHENKYELVERILNWCFSDDLKQVNQFKQDLYKDYPKESITWLLINLLTNKDQLQSLEKFCHWCFTNEEGMKQFQEWLLQTGDETVGTCICIALIWWNDDVSYTSKLKSADQLINWCCDALKLQVHEFKQQLMVDDNIRYMFQDIIENILQSEDQIEDQDDSCSDDDDQNNKTKNVDNYQDIKQIIMWFNPSSSTIIKFKEKFIDSDWLEHLVPILDTYLDNSRESQNNNQDTVAKVSTKRKLSDEDSDSRVKKSRNDDNTSLEEDDDLQHESSHALIQGDNVTINQDKLVLNSNLDKVISDTDTDTDTDAIKDLMQDLLSDLESMIHGNNNSLVNCLGDDIA